MSVNTKSIAAKYTPPTGHWVGDGFPVRSLISYDRLGAENISPFLLLDYAGPAEFEPSKHRRGVGEHPHRGFETVTIVYKGELEHRDSSGAGGKIGEGDVQWMTAGAGIVHEEFHSQAFSERGGEMEMVQLWVNLPASDKAARPAYQTLLSADIPVFDLDNGGKLRVIAGDFHELHGPASTFTAINVWDIRLAAGANVSLSVPEGHTALAVILNGNLSICGEPFCNTVVVSFSREGEGVTLNAVEDSKVLILTGAPIEEPVVGYGPFVMNTSDEIKQALTDFRSGKFGGIQN